MKKSPVIKNIKDATTIRDTFLNKDDERFRQLNPHHGRATALQKSRDLPTLTMFKAKYSNLGPELEKHLSNLFRPLQQKWRTRHYNDTLTSINPNGAHGDHVVSVINQNTNVKKNVNLIKQHQLLEALYVHQMKQDKKEGSAHPITNDPLFIQTAMGLFSSGQISRYQFETLQSYYQLQQPHKEIIKNQKHVEEKKRITSYPLKIYSILDEKGDWTDAAKKHLLPNLKGFMKLNITPELIENFRYMLLAFFLKYPTENNFCMVQPHLLEVTKDELAHQLSQKEHTKSPGLAATLMHQVDFKTVYKIKLSSAARDAIRLACFDVNDVVPSRVLLGDLQPQHISMGVKNGFRPKAGTYPMVPINTDIHEFQDVPPQTKADHDDYHADVMSRAGAAICAALNRSTDLARKNLLRKVSKLKDLPDDKLLSKGVWALIDGEFSQFSTENYEAPITPAEIAEAFGNALLKTGRAKGYYTYFDSSTNVTDLGITCFIDMAQNTQEWHQFNFHPELLKGIFLDHYNLAVFLKPYLHPTDSTYNIILYRLLQLVGPQEFQLWKQILDHGYTIMEVTVSVERNNLISFLGLVDYYTREPLSTSIWYNLIRSVIGCSNPQLSTLKLSPHDQKIMEAFVYFTADIEKYPVIGELLAPVRGQLANLIDHNKALDYKFIIYQIEKLNDYMNTRDTNLNCNTLFAPEQLVGFTKGMKTFQTALSLYYESLNSRTNPNLNDIHPH